MVTEKEMLKAISECEEGAMTPPKLTKLADLYTVYDHLFGYDEQPIYPHPVSERQKEAETKMTSDRSTEFLAFVDGKDMKGTLQILNELVEAVKMLHPRMYDSLIRKLNEL